MKNTGMSEVTSSDLLPTLELHEIRALGCLLEKERVTPEVYPMTYNGLMVACNQKTSRDPVLNLDQNAVEEAIRGLREHRLAAITQGGSSRVIKVRHLFSEHYRLDPPSSCLMALLFLRGPQTPGELRPRMERMWPMADVHQVMTFLDRLAVATEDRPALVVRLDRQPGRKEHRYFHCFAESVPESRSEAPPGTDSDPGPSLRSRVELLEEKVKRLERILEEALGPMEGSQNDD